MQYNRGISDNGQCGYNNEYEAPHLQGLYLRNRRLVSKCFWPVTLLLSTPPSEDTAKEGCTPWCTHRSGGQRCGWNPWFQSTKTSGCSGASYRPIAYISLPCIAECLRFFVTILMKVSKNCNLCIHQYDNKSHHRPNSGL